MLTKTPKSNAEIQVEEARYLINTSYKSYSTNSYGKNRYSKHGSYI